MKFNHLHLAVPDVAKAKQFYQEFFGMELAFDHGDGVFLKDKAGFMLALDPLGPDERVEFPKWYHHGFCLENKEQVRQVFERMKAAGVEFAREYREFEDYAANFYCWAPGPYNLEVSWNKD